MRILLYDKMLDAAGVPVKIISPALGDYYDDASSFEFDLAKYGVINCIGIGYTDASQVIISNGTESRTINITQDAPYQNGLYLIDPIYPGGEYDLTFTISHNGTYIGRVGIGEYRKLGTNYVKEIGFYTTNENRETLSGQVIPGAGGYYGRRFEADVRYKIDNDVYNDLLAAYQKQIMRGFPYFMLLDDEQHKLPATMLHFYADTDKPLSLLQSSTYKFLYSYKFQFYEKF
jgi:hypothetical protein